MRTKKILGAALATAGLMTAGAASAIIITPTLDATALGNALLGGGGAGIDLTSVVVAVSGQTTTAGGEAFSRSRKASSSSRLRKVPGMMTSWYPGPWRSAST